MKKLPSILPILAFVAVTAVGYKLLSAGTLTPVGFAAVSGALMIGMAFLRPKNAVTAKVNPEVITNALGEFGKDAFTDDSKESAAFQSAVKDFSGNMPKAAVAKLDKLRDQCRSDKERYAVAIISALAYINQNKFEAAILEYNRAVVLHPTSDLAVTIGSLQQRIGELKKARDSYEFALELDPQNVKARSAMATAWVASRKFGNALDEAELALELDDTNSSALATAAICHGILGHTEESNYYMAKAEHYGYSRKKMEDTIKALSK